MFDILAFLFFLGLGILIWAAIGHGIWLVLAAIGKALFGNEPDEVRTPCPHCGAPHGVIKGRCQKCGHVETVALPPSKLSEELASTLKHLDRLWRRGIITDDEHSRLRTACNRDLDRLLGRTPGVAEPSTAVSTTDILNVDADVTISTPADDAVEVVDAEVVETLADRVAEPQHSATHIHPLDRDEPDLMPVPAQPPRAQRALADVLSAFMQDRNIRWGELVSGLLIVGSAAGLVLSLRDQLREWIPYFPAFLFLLGTSAIHAAGLYTLRKWNLQSTSRGVLIITMLLVPLNFLAAVLLSGDDAGRYPVTSLTYITAVTVGLLAFGAIVYSGSRALADRMWPPLMLAIIGPSALQLVVNRTLAEGSVRTATATGSAALAAFILSIAAIIAIGANLRRLSLRRARPLLLTLALGGFATVVALSLVLTRVDSLWATLANLSPALSLAGASVVAAGLYLFKRTHSRRLTPLLVTGSALAIFGALIMVGAVAIAWPDPMRLVVVGSLCATGLIALAWLERTPTLHYPAIACAALTTLVAFHWWQGNLSNVIDDDSRQLLRTWLMGRSAFVLTALAAVVAAFAGVLARRQHRSHTRVLLIASGALAAASLLIAIRAGFFAGIDADASTITFVLYAGVLTAVAIFRPHQALSVAAPLLWLVTGAHALGYSDTIRAFLAANDWLPERPVLLITLIHALACVGVASGIALTNRSAELQRVAIHPLALTGFAISLAATWFAIAVGDEQFTLHSGYVMAIALVWFSAAILVRLPELMFSAQALSSLAIVYAMLALALRQEWWTDNWLDPRVFAIVSCGLAIWGIVWSIARRQTEGSARIRALLSPLEWSVDQLLLVLISAIVVVGSGVAAFFGAAEELAILPKFDLTEVSLFQRFTHPSVWFAVLSVALALGVALWERLRTLWFALAALLAAVPCFLLAIAFIEETAAASAMRWALSIYLLIAVTVICFRNPLSNFLKRLPGGWRGTTGDHTHILCTVIVLSCSAVVIVLLTVASVIVATQGVGPRLPNSDSFFAEISLTVSYVTPLLLTVVSLIALSCREKQPDYSLAGSAVWQLLASLGCIMSVVTQGGSFDAAFTVMLLQWNIVALGIYSLVWLGLGPWLAVPQDKRAGTFLSGQVFATLIALTGLSIWAATWVIGTTLTRWPRIDLPFATWPTALGFGIAALAAAWHCYRRERQLQQIFAGCFAGIGMPLISAGITPLDTSLAWTGYHALLSGWLLIAAISAGCACALTNRRVPMLIACALLAVVVTLSAVSGWQDPVPTWATSIHLVALLTVIGLGVFARRQVFAYASVVLALLATSQAFVLFQPRVDWEFMDFAAANLLAATLISAFWLGIEIDHERHARWQAAKDRLLPLPLTITPVMVVIAACLMMLCLSISIGRASLILASSAANLVMLGALGAYLLGMLWYDRQRLAIPCLYVWGLTVCLVITERLAPTSELRLVALPTAVAIFIALTGWLWQAGARLAVIGQSLGIHEPVIGLQRTSRWLPTVVLGLAGVVCVADFGFVILSDSTLIRYLAAFGPVCMALGILALAQLERRTGFLYGALLCGAFAAILLSWAELPPDGNALMWLRRGIRVLVVTGMLAFLFAAIFPRVWSHLQDWLTALRRMAFTCASIAAGALLLILLVEVFQFPARTALQLSNGEVGIVALVLVLSAGTLLALAISSPFTERRGFPSTALARQGYVYAAQLVLALAFGHLYLTRPFWFDGLLRPYWPYIIVTIAFAGVGLAEWFDRIQLRVLAEPLRRTGAFLPLLPAIGWWVEASRGTPSTEYSAVMFTVGMLYVVLSVCRQSPLSGLVAALCGNIALWSLMSDRGLSFLAHPQFWLIPPAVSVLAALQVNQKRLTTEQLAASRYACMLVIYLSSTSEIFVAGMTSIWPPLLLATLAVAGVLVGIAFQIRAFLYLGTSFVFLSMVTMVWHASRAFGQVWPWWVFGICVGLGMLVLFGLFEKKRTEITAIIERLRQWEP